jgi:peptidoglycan/xylan/chitin deacetylase (PgdA/CDA1 family)
MVLLVAVVIGAVAAAHMLPFPFLLEAFRPRDSVWRVKHAAEHRPTIYLTFDDGPNATWTPPLLDALRDHGIRATFFLIDEHIAAETAPIVRRMADEGHAIGLHSGTRRLMILPSDGFAEQIQKQAARIEAITGRGPCRLFRPHAGWRSQTMYGGLKKAGYRLAGWSWGMWDWDWWRTPRGHRIASRLAKKASPGDIIVIHDGHHADPAKDRSHAAATVHALVPILKSRGFQFDALC